MTTLIGSGKGTNSATASGSPAIGDVMVVWATRNASASLPTIPAGFIKLGAGGTANTNSDIIAWKYLTTASGATGTFTNATEVIVHVYRGTAGNAWGIGAFLYSSGSSVTTSYGGITLYDTSGNSWVALFGQTKTQSVGVNGAITGFTLRQDELGTGESVSFDSNGGVSSFATKTQTITTSVWKTAVVEILDIAPDTSTYGNHIIWHCAFPGNSQAAASSDQGNNFVYNCPEATLAGNGLLLTVAYPIGNTPAITDDQGNTWPVSGAALTTRTVTGGAMAMQSFYLANPATGTSKITVGFGSVAICPVHVWLTQVTGITGLANSVSAATQNTNGVLSPGSFTPTANNANGGNIVISYAGEDSVTGTTNPFRFIPASGFSLLDADISGTQGQWWPKACQFQLQATSAAVTAKFQLAGGGTDTYNVLAIALAVGVQGTLNDSKMHIVGQRYFGTNNNLAAWQLQNPMFGNLLHACGFMSSAATPTVTSIVSSDLGNLTQVTATTAVPNPYYLPGATVNPNRNLVVNMTGTAQSVQLVTYDISGADPVSPLDTSATLAGNTSLNNLSSISGPSITPGGTNRLFIGFMQIGLGPATSVSVPSGAVFDLPTFQQAQFTATIALTSMAVTATAWGTINANQEVVTGAGVTAGTAIQSGTGPYTIQPSQSIAVGETMNTSMDDSNTMGFGNSAWHWFNGSNVGAQNVTTNFANQPSNSGGGTVVIYKAPSSTALPFSPTDIFIPRKIAQAPVDLSRALNPNIFTNPIPVFNQFEPAKPQRLPLAMPTPPLPLNPNLFTNPYPFFNSDQSSSRQTRGYPSPDINYNPNLEFILITPLPFNQYDYAKTVRVPQAPFSPDQALNIVLYDILPFAQYHYEQAFRVPPTLPQPSPGLNLNLFTNPIPFLNLATPPAWPVRGFPSPDIAYNAGIYHVIITVMPFTPTDVFPARKPPAAPLPDPPLNINLFTNPIPFSQFDWSKPIRVPQARLEPNQASNINLYSNPIPFLNVDFSRPRFQRPIVDLTQPYNTNLYGVAVISVPFNQYDYGRPFRPIILPQNLNGQFNLSLFPNPIPFNQFYYPQTIGVPRAPYDLSVSLNLELFLNPVPFSQFSYPQARAVPKAPYDLSAPQNLNLPPTPIVITGIPALGFSVERVVYSSWPFDLLIFTALAHEQSCFKARASDSPSGQNWSGAGYMAKYEIDTEIQINGEFINSLTGVYIDPTSITLFVLDPSGATSNYTWPSATIVRDSLGHFHQQITPSKSGTWTYKWQATGAAICTSPDTTFTVNASALIAG